MTFGEIYICRFPYTSGATSKPRPALMLFDIGLDAVICRITSVGRTGTLEIRIADWAAAGLAKPSVVRLNRLVTAEKTTLHRRLGELSAADKAVVRSAWNAHMMLP
jgi:mRNA-degrading endonuclease toxin of MazEF toxin-antitoxin module